MLTSDQYGQLLAAIAVITRQCHSPQDLLTTAEGQLAQLVGQAVDVRVSPQERDGPVVRCSATSALDAQSQELLELFTVHFRCLLVQAQYCERLVTEALRDPLTGLLNRRAFERDLNGALDGAVPSTLVILDIRQFKRINDTFGHFAGDAVLREFTRRVSGAMRSYDAIGRYGGEEFLVVLPGCDDLCTASQAERMRVSVSQDPMMIDDQLHPLTASFGAVCFRPEMNVTAEALIRIADDALYQAKRQGRNQTVVSPCKVYEMPLAAG